MDTSDDPITAAVGAIVASEAFVPLVVAGTSIASMAMGSKQASKGGKAAPMQSTTAIPGMTDTQAVKTAEPVSTLSEQAKRNRRLSASMLTKDFAEPTLSIPALKLG